jgi:hypothetical protein
LVERSIASRAEIVVTATRHEENLSKVPISITALTQDAMDVRGIKDILDVARFTPGLNIDNTGTNNIAIRGIASTGGAGTTGIYLDDTPIQIRALAFKLHRGALHADHAPVGGRAATPRREKATPSWARAVNRRRRSRSRSDSSTSSARSITSPSYPSTTNTRRARNSPRLERDFTFRPRTIGLTFIYRSK